LNYAAEWAEFDLENALWEDPQRAHEERRPIWFRYLHKGSYPEKAARNNLELQPRFPGEMMSGTNE
jgi:hypothetical protein